MLKGWDLGEKFDGREYEKGKAVEAEFWVEEVKFYAKRESEIEE